MELHEEQKNALSRILAWVGNAERSTRSIFRFSGLAGTGKTTCLSVLVDRLKKRNIEPLVLAFTNQAVNVLRRKGIVEARTLHSALYKPLIVGLEGELTSLENKIEYLENVLAENPNQENAKKELEILERVSKKLRADIKAAKASNVEATKVSFFVNQGSACAEARLIIIDEASMIRNKFVRDIQSVTDAPIILVGDSAQLGPVKKNGFRKGEDVGPFHAVRPDTELRVIHRTDEDSVNLNDILSIARKSGNVPLLSCDVFEHVDFNSVKLDGVEQVIVGTNKNRFGLHARFREDVLGYSENKPPQRRERIICVATAVGSGLDDEEIFRPKNGQQFKIVDIQYDVFVTKRHDGSLRLTTEDDPDGEPYNLEENDDIHSWPSRVPMRLRDLATGIESWTTVPTWRFKALAKNGNVHKSLNVPGSYDYAYAITVHKAQGSEWATVMVADDFQWLKKKNPSGYRRWLYTALSRAKKKVLYARV